MRIWIFMFILISVVSCSTTKNHCRVEYTDKSGDTVKVIGLSRATVVGGGKTESVVDGVCGGFTRRTQDTGITPEGRKTVGGLSNAIMCVASKGLVCHTPDNPEPPQ